MSTVNCSACSDLQDVSPSFVQKGVTSTICSSLKNNTGLNPKLSTLHENEEDLHLVNDCLVGRMTNELPAYDNCQWKDFMKKFIPNVRETLKALICAVSGLWCWVKNLTETQTYVLHAYVDDDPTKSPLNGFKIASGVHVRAGSADDVPMRIYISGTNAYLTGSLTFDGNMPTDYTNGQTVRWLDFHDGGTDITNIYGESSYEGNAPDGGLFIYQYEIDPCEFGFEDMFPCHMLCDDAGDFVFRARCIKEGQYYPHPAGIDFTQSSKDKQYIKYVPSESGKVLIQVRLINVRTWGITHNNGNVTPNGTTGIVPCPDGWSC